jgi:micrococcal nuclease
MSRRRLAISLVVALVPVVALAVVLRAPGAPSEAVVERVIDGDTIVVAAGGREERVRLLGIDTPETVDPDEPVGCFGPQSSAYAHRLLEGRRVRLEYDQEERDRYGRLLAYVYLDGGRVFANARLVAGGYARTLVFPPNTRHAATLERLERRAAVAGRGLWGAC